MGKTFRKNIEYGGGTAASNTKRYRTHNRSKKSGVLNTDTDEFHRGRNYQKSKFVWNTTPHGRRAPARKGMPPAYAASARARQQQQVDRQAYQWQLLADDRAEERCEEAYQDVFEQEPQFTTQELNAITEWNTPLIVKAGSDIFRMHDTYTYTLVEDHYTPTSCLVRKIGDKFYCITVDDLMDYPDLAYDDDLWIVHSIGILLWRWKEDRTRTLILPDNKNMDDIQGEFVAW
tara:strand:- start:5020 stop:5715 length:696 start_codon:yes stop_codon:yes gene_type:complete